MSTAVLKLTTSQHQTETAALLEGNGKVCSVAESGLQHCDRPIDFFQGLHLSLARLVKLHLVNCRLGYSIAQNNLHHGHSGPEASTIDGLQHNIADLQPEHVIVLLVPHHGLSNENCEHSQTTLTTHTQRPGHIAWTTAGTPATHTLQVMFALDTCLKHVWHEDDD